MSNKQATSITDELIDQASHLNQQSFAEKRDQERQAYNAEVNLILLSSNGSISTAIKVKAIDISQGGICIRSRNMIHVGAIGGIELIRSDGSRSLVGVQVRHCRYIGEMMHDTGLKFIPLPVELANKTAGA